MNKIEWGIIYIISTVAAIWWWKNTGKFEKLVKDYIGKKIKKSESKGKNIFSMILGEILVWGLALVFVVFIQQLYLGNFKVPTGSMEPTIKVGDRVFSNMAKSKFSSPIRDSIVMFIEPVAEKLRYTKRVVGLAGETVQISDNGYLLINDQSLENQRKYSKTGLMGENTWRIPKKSDKITLSNAVIRVQENEFSLSDMKNKIASGQIKNFENVIAKSLNFTINGKTYKEGLFSFITDLEDINSLLTGKTLEKNGNKIKLINGKLLTSEIISNPQEIKKYLNKDFELVSGEFRLNGKDLTGPISNKDILVQLLEGKTVELKENYYFMLGDNTDNSQDSRYWGFVKESAIKGSLIFRYWPLNRIGIMIGD